MSGLPPFCEPGWPPKWKPGQPVTATTRIAWLTAPGWIAADGTKISAGFVDRNSWPEIPDSAFERPSVKP